MGTFSADQIRAYLERVGHPVEGAELPRPNVDLLRALHSAHLQAVPFENLDIVRLGREIVLDPVRLYGKIVDERRGGYCFEVNGLLAAVLERLGFGVTRVMVRFVQEGGALSEPFDHLALIVAVPDGADRVLVDVGSGRQAFARPLRMVSGVEQHQPEVDTTYRLDRDAEDAPWVLSTKVGDGDWLPWYTFDETDHALAEFQGRNAFFQSAEDSPFRQGPLATISQPGGRLTVTGDRLIETTGGVRTEREITPEEADRILTERFGILFPAPTTP